VDESQLNATFGVGQPRTTIVMADGSVFDYANPASTTMSIEDYAFGQAYESRFNGQTRCVAWGGKRAFYSVAQHCIIMAQALLDDGYGRAIAYEGLMHEPGETVCKDMPAPAKAYLPGYRDFEKHCGSAIAKWFGVPDSCPALIKHYDLRLLATENRDLRPHLPNHRPNPDYPPLGETIVPYHHPDQAAHAFLAMYRRLAPSDGMGK
jgi:hypothetical protein